MQTYQYLIVGGGMTADAAVRGIRKRDTTGTIGLFSTELDPPYNRPPLTKGLWKGKPVDSINRKTAERGVDLHLGCPITRINTDAQLVLDGNGREYHYQRLLIATGGSPRELPYGKGEFLYYRTLQDYRNVREQVGKVEVFGIIGGGFIGSELAVGLRMNSQEVTMVFPEPAIGSRIFPPGLASFVNETYTKKGVRLLAGSTSIDLQGQPGDYQLVLKDGQNIACGMVIAGIGLQPNTALAEEAGLEVDNGILVNETLQTKDANIFSAGDVASFYNPLLDKRMRVEHEDNANTMGEVAGENMAGGKVPYTHLPYFYSDMFELGYEAIGELDSRLEMVEDWQEPNLKGVIYYLKSGRVRGVLLWNVWGQVNAARSLIGEPGPFRLETLRGRIPFGD